MAINALNAALGRQIMSRSTMDGVGRPRSAHIARSTSWRYAVPAATYQDQVHASATGPRGVAERVLFETWGWG